MQTSSAESLRQIRVLLIDDSEVFVRTATAFLKRMPDVEVVGAALNGEEGLRQVKALSPDVALVDINMPGMSGYAVITTLRDVFPNVRPIVMSLPDCEEHREAVRAYGAAAFVCKSDLVKELPMALHQVVS